MVNAGGVIGTAVVFGGATVGLWGSALLGSFHQPTWLLQAAERHVTYTPGLRPHRLPEL